jgi:hypothetical protein
MSTRGHCAICGAEDRFKVGVCASCASDGHNWRLLLVQPPIDHSARATVSACLREWLGIAGIDNAVEETARGRRMIAMIPAPIAGRAAEDLAEAGIPNRLLRTEEWYRALPPHFALMIAAIAVTGGLAGLQVFSFMMWGTPLLITLLLVAAWQQLRTPLVRFARTQPTLPAKARASLATALVQLPVGPVREVLLDLARVAEHTHAALPEAFREHSLGQSVVELVVEAGSLSLETCRLQAVSKQLHHHSERGTRESLDTAVKSRITLLGQALSTLGRIARDASDSPERTSEMKQLIEQLRREQQWRGEGQAAVERILSEPR